VKKTMSTTVRIERKPPRLVAWAKSEGTFLKMSRERTRFSNDIIKMIRILRFSCEIRSIKQDK